MRQSNLAVLLAHLTSLQTDGEPHAEFGAERMAETIRGRRKIEPEEVDALWRSPHLRDEFLTARRSVIGQSRADWHQRGFDAPAVLRAAASEGGLSTVPGNGWKVEILQVAPGEWAISLAVSPELRTQLPALAEIHVIDDGGLIWGRGRLADDGTLDFEWPHVGGPLERLRAYALSIAPI